MTERALSYMTATGPRDGVNALERYLGFGAYFEVHYDRVSRPGSIVAVVAIDSEYAEWQSMRFASGMAGGHIFATIGEAAEDARKRAAL